MDRGDDRPDKDAVDASAAPFTLIEGPDHTRAPESSPLSGYYRAAFEGSDGRRITRFLTDMGYAQVIARRGEGRAVFDADEFDLWTVPPDVEAIEARVDAEAGQGA